ncbi:MAG: alpha/beta hydrolase [bacterium]|nr:alpha/beta hydrolase [bacterium]
MSKTLPAAPYRMITASDGSAVPWYIMPFDERGRCTAPLTRREMLERLSAGGFTDVYLFSHGWNNDWEVSSERYDSFIQGFIGMRKAQSLQMGRPYKPLLIGIFWPSTALVLPWERAPRMAGIGGVTDDAEVADERAMVQELSRSIAESEVERFYELAQKAEGLDEREALELASLLLSVGVRGGDELSEQAGEENATPQDLVAAWHAAQAVLPTGPEVDDGDEPLDDDDFGTADGAAATPDAAGLLSALDPRNILRLTTVLQMKDRAGVVGARGVSPLLAELLASSDARAHLVGHSYGGKVVLSAVCQSPLPRKVQTLLLLQPAVSRLCFAADTGAGHAGGYRPALDRCGHILSTFSRKDAALTKFFHLAARRARDLGELRIAAGSEPSKYAALGGFGPGGLAPEEMARVKMKQVGEGYGLEQQAQPVLALEGHEAIGGHGDISNSHTWWALFDAVKSSG